MTTPAGFTILEHACTPKHPGRVCEDGVVVTEHFAAVVDGATTPHAIGTSGRTTGRIALEAVTAVLDALTPDATRTQFLHACQAAIAAAAAADGLDAGLPVAVAVVYSAARRELWVVGDCRWAIDGSGPARVRRDVDDVAVEARALILTAAMSTGTTAAQLRAHDIGRERTAAIRAAKVAFRNAGPTCRWAFAALAGDGVPGDHLVRTVPVPAGAHVVLTTDGYLSAAPTLAAAESELTAALVADPLCIGPAGATKCPQPGWDSFDDRTYLRLVTHH